MTNMFEIVFICVGLYCGDGALFPSPTAHFLTLKMCEVFGRLMVGEHVPVKGMTIEFQCRRLGEEDL
jgi:hypothetical protein